MAFIVFSLCIRSECKELLQLIQDREYRQSPLGENIARCCQRFRCITASCQPREFASTRCHVDTVPCPVRFLLCVEFAARDRRKCFLHLRELFWSGSVVAFPGRRSFCLLVLLHFPAQKYCFVVFYFEVDLLFSQKVVTTKCFVQQC